jgi:hypothetical protein
MFSEVLEHLGGRRIVYLQVRGDGRPVLARLAARLGHRVQLVVHELAVVHVAAGVQVRAVAQRHVRPGEQQAPEVEPATCERRVVCPAGQQGALRVTM